MSNVSATRNLGIKHLIIGGENEDWKVPEMQLPKVSTCNNDDIGNMHFCTIVQRTTCMLSGRKMCCAMPQGQMDPMQTNMPFDDDQFRQFEDGLFDDDD